MEWVAEGRKSLSCSQPRAGVTPGSSQSTVPATGVALLPLAFPAPSTCSPSVPHSVCALLPVGQGRAVRVSELLRGGWGHACGMAEAQRHPLVCSWQGQAPGGFSLAVGGGYCLGCKFSCYHHCIFLPSPILAPGTVGSGRQQAQRLSKETKCDKWSMRWPHTALLHIRVLTGLVHAPLLLRLSGFYGLALICSIPVWLKDEKEDSSGLRSLLKRQMAQWWAVAKHSCHGT